MKKFLFLIPCSLFLVCAANASNCIQHKRTPVVSVAVPSSEKSVVQPPEPMDLFHGKVIATFSEEYSLLVEADPVEGGYCVVLAGVDATIGYNDFQVQIDSRHRPGSCAFDVILEHENLHIVAHLSVLSDLADDIKQSITAAADSIMPIFVGSGDGFDGALDLMQQRLHSHPDIVLMKQKIDAENTIRNKRIDMQNDDRRVRVCLAS